MKVSHEKISDDLFYSTQKEVLGSWHTGKDVEIGRAHV